MYLKKMFEHCDFVCNANIDSSWSQSIFYSVIYKLIAVHVSEFNTILANEILFVTHFNMLF